MLLDSTEDLVNGMVGGWVCILFRFQASRARKLEICNVCHTGAGHRQARQAALARNAIGNSLLCPMPLGFFLESSTVAG